MEDRSPVEEDTARTTRIVVDDVELPEIVHRENERLAQLEGTLEKLKRAQQSLSSVRE